MIKIVPAQQIVDELRALGFQEIPSPCYGNYACPDPDWLVSFGAYCRENQPARPEEKERGNCNASAIWCVDKAGAAWRLSTEFHDAGCCVCYCRVVIPVAPVGHEDEWDGTPVTLNGIPTWPLHSTCVIRGSNNVWVFFEPQTGLWTGCRDAIDSGIVADRRFVLP
jgi:hypothetical protein